MADTSHGNFIRSDYRPHVVVVGAGFGGLATVRALARQSVRITLIDRTNHHLFQPLLYQVATAGLNPAEISAPVRSVLSRQKNVTCLMGIVRGIDFENRQVHMDDRRLDLRYDYLVLAAGGLTSYFGHPEWEKHAPGLKTLEDARSIRESVLMAFEKAEKEPDPAIREKLLTIVVVGGGPTGVEMAGALAELARHVLVRDFRNIHPQSARVILLEGMDRVLGAFSRGLSEKTMERLTAMGVEVRTGVKVLDLQDGLVKTSTGDILAANTVWAAGVRGAELGEALGASLDRAGRVVVDAELRLPGHPEVYALGDMAHFEHPHTFDGKVLPAVSPVAIQQGKSVAANIARQLRSEAPLPFHYKDPGSLATIGRSAAVGAVKGVEFSGFVAWLVWLFVHLMNLVDFENRVVVFTRWAWAYFSWKRGSRVITRGIEEIEAGVGKAEQAPPVEVRTGSASA